MAGEVLGIVLALTIRVVGGLGEDAGTALAGMFAVTACVGHAHKYEMRAVPGCLSFGDYLQGIRHRI